MVYNGCMQTDLILHGHFYQPPRENPWTGLIPHQPSAAPFHDWNKRITQECYAANCYSRYLGAYGEILDISNNYEILSFNFGPTLMRWLKAESPNIYEKIIEADKISRQKNGGHGNAIAQVYNHVINGDWKISAPTFTGSRKECGWPKLPSIRKPSTA